MKQLRFIVGAGLAVAFVATGCASSSNSQGHPNQAKQGGVLRIGTDQGIDSLNPFVGLNQDSFNAWEQTYPQLVQYNPRTLGFEPDFATSWHESSNQLTWTFHTVPNAKWSDGQPLTANDVAWIYNTIIKFKSGPTAALAGAVNNMASVTAPDQNTVVIRYKRPIANVLSNVQQIPILPRHVWASYATGNGKGMKTYPNTPTGGKPLVSGGPFMVTKWVKDQITLFQANPNWYGLKPHIQAFGLEQFSNDDAMVQSLKTNQIDAIEGVPVTAVAPIKAAGFHVYVGPSLWWRDLIINPNPHKTTHRELLNPLVRQAFEYAIDRNAIVKTAWVGYATPGSTLVPPATGKWHDPIQPLPFDLAKANQLLDQAGYKIGSNGIRSAGGHPMTYQVDFSSDQNGPGDRVFQIIQADFKKIGVQLTQRVLDPTAEFNAITANKYANYDLAMWYWVPIVDPDFILSVYTCSQWYAWSDSGYCNPAYDRLYKEQAVTTDPQKRLQIVYRMQKMIYESRAEIVLVYNDTIDTWSNKWTGFVESSQGLFTQLSKKSLESVHLR
jgi:peptide/nickel transport system substrate-binding protein